MPAHHNPKHPSRPKSTALRPSTPGTPFASPATHRINPHVPTINSMPPPERNQYSNKESVKVNAGLYPYALSQTPPHPPISLDIPFSTLHIPLLPPEPPPSIAQIAHRLSHPPAHAFVHGVLSMQWVFGVVGIRAFEFRRSDERYVLRWDSELRVQGREVGVPGLLMEWLCGDEEGVGAGEQGVFLTTGYFEGLERHMEREDDNL